MSRLPFGLLLATYCALYGCQRPNSPAASPTSSAATQPAAAATPSADTPAANRPTLLEERRPQPTESTEPGEPSEPAEPVEPTKPLAERAPRERVLLLTPEGPLLLAVRLTLDGRPPSAALAELVNQVLAAGRAANDDRKPGVTAGRTAPDPTWAALIANDDFLQSPTGGGRDAPPRERQQWPERFDLNRDGRIQPSEAAAWLGRNGGGAARAFSVRSRRSYRPDPRAASRLWSLLEADGDGLLSSDELHAAADRLGALDANDDESLAPGELVALREQVTAGSGSTLTGVDGNHYAAFHLEADFDEARLSYLLSDLYAPRQDLRPASFGTFERLGASLDVNGDQWLAPSELAALAEAEPHLELSIAFPGGDPANPSPAVATLDRHAPEATPLAGTGGRLAFRIGQTTVVVSAHDLAPAQGEPGGASMAAAAVDRSQIRLMVHDQADGLYQQLDADGDGRLSAREIAGASERLAAGDRDGDGQLHGDELPRILIVAFLRGESAEEGGFYAPLAARPKGRLADAPEWFRQADFNNDGDVSRREFLGTLRQFRGLDANGDGFLDPQEAHAGR